MTSSVIERWHQFIDGGHDPAVLDALLARRRGVLLTGGVHPAGGPPEDAAYLMAAAKMFGGTDFHYVEEWVGDRSAVLEFAATVDGVYVNGIDLITWNDDDRIVSFKVMMRPFKGLQAIMPKMAELLQSN